MTSIQHSRARTPRKFTAVTVVCLILLALLAVVQVAHVHQLDTDADHCPLCIVMHSAAPVTLAAAVIVMVQLGAAAPVREVRAVFRTWHPTLFIRPPPSI
jgi:uncharacterized membrane protein YqhA